MGTYCRIHGPPKTQGGLLTASASRVPHSAHPLEAWDDGTCAGYVCACASARLTPEIAVAASSSLFLLSPRDSGPPWAQSLSGEGRQQPRMWGRPSPLPLLCLSLAALSSQLGSGARGEEGNLCEGQHGPWTTCWPLPKGSSPPCAPRSDTEAREPQVASGKSVLCRPRFPTCRRTGLAGSERQQVPHLHPSQPHSRLPGPLLSTWDGASHPGRGPLCGQQPFSEA